MNASCGIGIRSRLTKKHHHHVIPEKTTKERITEDCLGRPKLIDSALLCMCKKQVESRLLVLQKSKQAKTWVDLKVKRSLIFVQKRCNFYPRKSNFCPKKCDLCLKKCDFCPKRSNFCPNGTAKYIFKQLS